MGLENEIVACVYCGLRPGVTADHVVPKCLFPSPLPSDMVTVRACRECNEDKSKDDEYLRDYFVADLENEGNPLTSGQLRERLHRSARKNRSRLFRDMRERVRRVPVRTPAGLYLGDVYGMPIEGERLNRTFGRITRGLYYRLYQQRLPDDCTFDPQRVKPEFKQATVDMFMSKGPRPIYSIGETFECTYAIATEDPTVTFWLQRYFNIFITVSTNLGRTDRPNVAQPKLLTSWLSSR